MVRCGCAKGACFCRFANSDTTTVTGSGSATNPFLVRPKAVLQALSTPSLGLTLRIAGDQATLEAQPIVAGHVDVFTGDGTWNKPAGVTFARVMMIGGGGGGASGSETATRMGGGGGDAGQVAVFNLMDAEIPASAAVLVGAGGAGGVGSNVNGAAGGNSGFGARRVRGGAGCRALGLAGVHLAAGAPPGQFAVNWDAEWNPAHYYLAPGAGGVGEGEDYDAQPGGYSHPGQGSRFPGNTGGGDAGGGNGRNEPVTKMGGGGGGGARGQAGGDGGNYGGGGGGGGYETGANPSGAGGDGANGILVVISW